MIKPEEVQRRAEQLEDLNIEFRTFLKSHADYDELDTQFMSLHTELFAGYDCCKCANCCRAYSTLLDEAEAERIAVFLGMTERDFHVKYLKSANRSDEKPFTGSRQAAIR